MKQLILAFITVIFLNVNAQVKKLPDTFYKKWIASTEENDNTKGINIYRPIDFKAWPPIRFRPQFDFKKDGKCIWLKLEPNDMQNFEEGLWKFYKKSSRLAIYDTKGKMVYHFHLQKIEDNSISLKLIDIK
ncbi:MAG: hypothetical protein JSU07_12130 [Bacteroidetes bacterium]|nr:hypothetical protein [Bacteroidota bacterium]